MSTHIVLIAELLISLVFSSLVLWVLSKPLMNVLRRVCPNEQAASFWLTYTRLMLIITPLLLVMVVDWFSHSANPGATLRLAFIACLIGVIAGLKVIGQRVGRFVVTPEKTGEKS